ncbi:MAG: Nramp family divalent metal transporter [Pseudomonadota bacterium]
MDTNSVKKRRTVAPQHQSAWGLGPGLMVTAAFVGPGTIATASAAGADFGYGLIWALVFSVFATMVLQEMSVRSAIFTGRGLAQTLRSALGANLMGRAALVLVVAAVGVGNAAYESGNIAGAALAMAQVTSGDYRIWTGAVGVIAGALLFLPAYRYLERVLVGLVLLMSGVFIFSALSLGIDFGAIGENLSAPELGTGTVTTVIALIGTTVVPYNLFLQANAAKDRWHAVTDRDAALAAARLDTILSIGLGGLVTLAILSGAAVSFFNQNIAFSSEAFVHQLDSVFGDSGRYLFGIGLFAAGLTSAITAPLAAAYAVCGALGWKDQMRGRRFRLVAITVLLTGVVFASTGSRPLALIVFAQAANGLLLPVIAFILLWLMNQRSLLGSAINGVISNGVGTLVVLVSLALGTYKLWGLFSS